jgi:hypothetical protein
VLIDPAISLAFALSLAALLGVSAARKLGAFPEFAGVVRNYDIAPASLSTTLAVLVVATEAALAVGLIPPATRSAAAFAAACLFAAYAAAIALNLMRGRSSIDCGCSFGASGAPISPALIYRNAVLVAFALAAAAPVASRALGAFDVLAIGLFAAAAAALYLANESLAANAARFYAAESAR